MAVLYLYLFLRYILLTLCQVLQNIGLSQKKNGNQYLSSRFMIEICYSIWKVGKYLWNLWPIKVRMYSPHSPINYKIVILNLQNTQ